MEVTATAVKAKLKRREKRGGGRRVRERSCH